MFVCLFFPLPFLTGGEKITTKIQIISRANNIEVIQFRITVSLFIYLLFFAIMIICQPSRTSSLQADNPRVKTIINLRFYF